MSDPVGFRLGRYVLGARLAAGGMGEVFVGANIGVGEFRKPLAIKLLLPHLADDPRAVEMFLDEARLAARMNHPNIVHIFDVGREADRYYLAMELVHGVALSTLCARLEAARRTVSADVILLVARCLCDALQYAHDLRGDKGEHLELVHRDVTPQNVLVSVAGEVKLSDFGIARARGRTSHTEPGSVRGKLEYAAPEQLRSKPLDRRADVFGAAVTLFQLATLRSPFRRDSEVETVLAVDKSPLPDLHALRPDLPRSFCDAVAKAGSKDPDARYASARDLREELPAPPSSAADELGALVRELCADTARFIEAKRSETLALTPSVDAQAPTQETANPLPPARRTNALLLAAGLATLAVAGGAFALLKLPRQTDARPAVATAAPSVDAGVEAAEEPVVVAPVDAGSAAVAVAVVEEDTKEPIAKTTRKAQKGYLNVDAIPWAEVWIAGRKAGETPLSRFPVKAGTVSVVLKNPTTKRTVKRTVKVAAGEQVFVRESLK